VWVLLPYFCSSDDYVAFTQNKTEIMPTSKKRRAERLALLVAKPPRELNDNDMHRIRFTQTHIHTQFSNNNLSMDVFDTYFAIKFGLMSLRELPPIRIYEYGRHLWSIDNRRLWIMRESRKFYYEGPYTKEHSVSRFIEFESKYSSLHGTSGERIEFHSNDPAKCCIDAWNSDKLDEHEIIDHLELTIPEFNFLIQCPIHHLSSCDCLEVIPNKTRTISLHQALSKRCQLIRQIVNKADIVLSMEKRQLLNRFDEVDEEELIARLHFLSIEYSNDLNFE